jgi:hypothetical protein
MPAGPEVAAAPSAGAVPPSTGAASQQSAAPSPDGPSRTGFAPYDLADSMRRLHGIDVSDVPISRGPEAGQQARAAGARAFTRAGEVVLPIEGGPVERPQTRALLAHELTHAAQQRALGPTLPGEDSAFGAALEAEAVGAERRVLGHDAASMPVTAQPLLHAVPRSATAAGMQRQAEEPAGAPAAGNAFDPTALLPRQGDAAASAASDGTSLQAAAVPDASTGAGAAAGAAVVDAGSRAGERAGGSTGKRLLDLDDSKAVRDLTDGIYKELHARLRHELLVGRERSGLLSDFR